MRSRLASFPRFIPLALFAAAMAMLIYADVH